MPKRPNNLMIKNELMSDNGELLSKSEIALNKRIKKFDENKITDERLLKVLDDGLNAVRIEKEIVDGLVEEREIPDHNVRSKYIDMAFKAKGFYAPIEMKTEINVDARRVSVNISAEEAERLVKIADTLRDMNRVLEMGEVQDGEIINVS